MAKDQRIWCCSMNTGGRKQAGTGSELLQPTKGEATTRVQVAQRENMAMSETHFEVQSGGRWQDREFVCTGVTGREESKVTPGLLAAAAPQVGALLPVLGKSRATQTWWQEIKSSVSGTYSLRCWETSKG